MPSIKKKCLDEIEMNIKRRAWHFGCGLTGELQQHTVLDDFTEFLAYTILIIVNPICLLVLYRVSEREAALEETHRLLQQFPLDLEKFLSWITEAETTANVLQDASRKEKLLEGSKGVRELMKQWQVSQVSLC